MADSAKSSSRPRKPTKPKATTKPKKTVRKSTAKRPVKSAPAKRPVNKAAKVVAPVTKSRRLYGRLFVGLSLVVLIGSTVFWAILSARLQRFNADQLIDTDLLRNWTTFSHASFPGAHTFLIKWPIFALMALFGDSVASYTVTTVIFVLITVLALAYALFRIERRPFVLGTLFLALASVLLLVPAQPAPGGLLPVNMAMLTTRNLEYVMYMASVYALVRAKRLGSRWFWLAAALAGVLMASDKLFVALYVGGAALAVLTSLYVNRSKLSIGRRPVFGFGWLLNGVIAFAIAGVVLRLITASHLTHIVNQATTSPYALVDSPKQFVQAVIYGVGAFFTNFGANPVQSVVVAADIPRALVKSLGHFTTLAYILNGLILLTGLGLSGRLLKNNLKMPAADRATRFSIVLIWSTLAALMVFVFTNHYAPVDSRYLTIGLFAIFCASAVVLRRRKIRNKHSLTVALIIALCLPLAFLGCWHEYQRDAKALMATNRLDQFIATQLTRYNVGTVIGNYWDVTPLKTYAKSPINVVPMGDCHTPQLALSSTAWLTSPATQSIAYLALKNPAGSYSGCSASQLEAYYGTPSTRVVLTGKSTDPTETLWVYNAGVHHVVNGKPQVPTIKAAVIPSAVVVPVLAKHAQCPDGTLMNIVAHEDDDILFTSPDLLHAIQAGKCVTTVYLTAGDAGGGLAYWEDREAGAEAAYSNMFNNTTPWRYEFATVNGHEVGSAYLPGSPKVTLIFLHLPDGGPHGQGFAADNYESLNDLRMGTITTIHGVYGSSAYTKPELITTLTDLMDIYQPDEIHTQDYSTNINDGDHSDHHAAGYFTKLAYKAYPTASVLKSYAGYPGHKLPPNVFGQDEAEKDAAFFAYAAHDSGACTSVVACNNGPSYGGYLARQYSVVDATHN